MNRAETRPVHEPVALPRWLATVRHGWLVALVACAAVAGIVLRIVLLGSSAGTLDSDDAVVGLMTKHAAHGHIPLLFWGQNYGGTQEVLLTAPLYLVSGTSTWALRAVPFVLVALTAVLVWRIGLRISTPVSAVAAAALFWVAPAYLIFKTSHQHGFYAAGLFWSAALLLLVLRFVDSGSRRDAALLGLAFGLAWWETPQIVTVAVPALAWLVWYRPSVLRQAWAAIPFALVGMVPWLTWNARHDWSSVTNPPGSSEPMTFSSYVDHVRAYVSSLTPMNLDLRTPFTSTWPIGKLPAIAVYAALLVAFGWFAWRHRRQPVSLLAVVLIGYPLMYAISPASWNASEPRYALLSLPALALVLAYPLRTVRAAWAGVAVAAGLCALTLVKMDNSTQVLQGGYNPRHYAPLIADLDRSRVDRVYSDYWIAYRLTFETDERIIASHANLARVSLRHGHAFAPSPGWSRNWAYNRAVNRSPRTAVVIIRGNPLDPGVRKVLVPHGYRRDVIGQFVVYVPENAAKTSRSG